MNNRNRSLAILRYQNYDRMPVVHFGYWGDTIAKWGNEGHIEKGLDKEWGDGNEVDTYISDKLGFDFNWYNTFSPHLGLLPSFEREVLEEKPDGTRIVLNWDGVIVVEKEGVSSISSEIDHTLKDRASWEEKYLPKLRFSKDRINFDRLNSLPQVEERDRPLGLHAGSYYGHFRNYAGVVGSSYMAADDEELYVEIIDTIADMQYMATRSVLETGVKFDFGHFWEDICFKNGPLVNPDLFREVVGPHYKKMTDLFLEYDIDIVSLDCDGMIDALIPTWIENGVNTMFPMEVGTWRASIKPWREKYGKTIRGVGGMDKVVFSRDYKSVDEEVERLKPLVEIGGYIPCPDHRIAPDAKWENVQYYCSKMRKVFG
ncbi:MAG: hypothetical protein JXN10_09460 [Clostridia bacterium]|nr:hypothetical protein [Clostridia bacterium]MBN2883744.1 hypothetical protein [Clostridia bacterium]